MSHFFVSQDRCKDLHWAESMGLTEELRRHSRLILAAEFVRLSIRKLYLARLQHIYKMQPSGFSNSRPYILQPSSEVQMDTC